MVKLQLQTKLVDTYFDNYKHSLYYIVEAFHTKHSTILDVIYKYEELTFYGGYSMLFPGTYRISYQGIYSNLTVVGDE